MKPKPDIIRSTAASCSTLGEEREATSHLWGLERADPARLRRPTRSADLSRLLSLATETRFLSPQRRTGQILSAKQSILRSRACGDVAPGGFLTMVFAAIAAATVADARDDQ